MGSVFSSTKAVLLEQYKIICGLPFVNIVVRIFVEHPLLFVVRKYTLSFYLLKQQQPVEMHSSYAVAPNQTHYFTSLGMRNSVIQNQIDIENINYENALTESEDYGKMDNPGQPDDETFTNKIVDGIDFNLVLRTIPNKFRREASENLEVNGVIDTISSKIIPRWDDKQRSEAVKKVLGDDGEGIYAKILLNIFKVNEHIECTRSHKSFIEKTFHRFKAVFPHLQEKSILAHDQSKLGPSCSLLRHHLPCQDHHHQSLLSTGRRPRLRAVEVKVHRFPQLPHPALHLRCRVRLPRLGDAHQDHENASSPIGAVRYSCPTHRRPLRPLGTHLQRGEVARHRPSRGLQHVAVRRLRGHGHPHHAAQAFLHPPSLPSHLLVGTSTVFPVLPEGVPASHLKVHPLRLAGRPGGRHVRAGCGQHQGAARHHGRVPERAAGGVDRVDQQVVAS